MVRIAHESDELESQLVEQLGFLNTSAQLFDQGYRAEAKRLATTLRILFHEKGMSHSLLGQLGLLDKLRWLDSAGEINAHNLMASNNLVLVSMSTSGKDEYVPWLGTYYTGPMLPPEIEELMRVKGIPIARRPGAFLDFAEWWDMEVVKDSEGRTFSRSDLVLAVANMDGGAHVDPGLPANFHALSRGNSMGWKVGADLANMADFSDNPVLASIRQIAYETLASI